MRRDSREDLRGLRRGPAAAPAIVNTGGVNGVWAITAPVAAAGFFAPERASGDECGDEEEVLGLPAGWRVEDFVEGVAGPEVDHLAGVLEARAGAFDAGVPPHGGAKAAENIREIEFTGFAGADIADDGDGGGRRAEADGLALKGGISPAEVVVGFSPPTCADGAGDLSGGLAGGVTEDEAFEEGVAGEAVGTVEASAGDFSDGKEAREAGATEQVGGDAADGVMSGGIDGDEVFGGIEIDGVEECGDSWEALSEAIEVADIEPDVGAAVGSEAADDGAADDIAWSKFGEGVLVEHEAVAGVIEEVGALAANGFGDKGTRAASEVEGCGMKLDEGEVLDDGASAVGHGEAVGGSAAWVGGFAEDHTCAAGSEDGGFGPDHLEAVLGVVRDGAHDGGARLGGRSDEVEGEAAGEDADAWREFDAFGEAPDEFAAGGVAERMEDACVGVAAFATECEGVRRGVEG